MAKLKFELNSNEYLVMKSEAVLHGGIMAAYTDGLVLTNQSLVWVPRGVFGNTKRVERFVLRDVKVVDGRPQVFASDRTLEIHFRDGQEIFAFQRKKEARAWAKNLCTLLGGGSDDFVDANDKALPGAEYVAESLRDTLAAVKRPFTTKSRKKVAQGCRSCGASISGPAGQVVRCGHCGSDEQLPKR